MGSDVLTRWHSKGGRLFLILVCVQAGAALEAWAQTRQENLATALIAVLGLPGIMATTLGTLSLFAIAGISVGAARRRVSHEAWHGVHLLTYVAISLSFLCSTPKSNASRMNTMATKAAQIQIGLPMKSSSKSSCRVCMVCLRGTA